MSKSGFTIVDADIHCLEPDTLWYELIDPQYRDVAPKRQSKAEVPGRLEVLGRPIPAKVDHICRKDDYATREKLAAERFEKLGRISVPQDGTSPDSMQAAMNLEGIDAGIVYRTDTSHAIAHDDMDPFFASAICRAFNSWLSEFCKYNPKRLYPSAVISLHDTSLAIQELKRARTELNAVAVVLPSNPVKGFALGDQIYDDFWRIAQELDVTIAVHGIQLAYQEHLGNRYLDNFALMHAAAHPIELMLAMGSIITGGVLARFPRLRFAFLEGQCSWLPFWLNTLDDRWIKFGRGNRHQLKKLPSEYFFESCFVSCDPDERNLCSVIDQIGSSNILFASDWPHHDSLYPKAVVNFLENPGLSNIDRQNILSKNAESLYRITI